MNNAIVVGALILLAGLLVIIGGMFWDWWHTWHTPVIIWIAGPADGETDDTARIQAAINYAGDCQSRRHWYQRQCIVGIPPGTWTLVRPLDAPGLVRIEGRR